MKESDNFEIIDKNNARHRFSRAEGYSWEWNIKPGTVDVEDYSVVRVLRSYPEDDDSCEVVNYFPNPAMVGNVREDQCLSLRERPVALCPRCGYKEIVK